ncbi:MAG: threonine synthase [bacterium]|nr:threonine synthase [bacterium]
MTVTYISTRGRAPELAFGDVLLTGLATDGGLYVPQTWPALSPAALSWNPSTDSYADLAVEVMWPFVDGTYSRNRFEELVRDAYSHTEGAHTEGGFSRSEVAPMVELGGGIWLMELFHGPTLAFKDIALQLVGRLFAEELEKTGKRVTIVGATSGDTGSAAIEAVRDRPNIQIVILHPKGRVSEIQRRQMTTVDSANVHNVAIEGTFDDCQDLVKAMFADADFRREQQLSAVNSINWARVMAQIVYYVAAARWLAVNGIGREVAQPHKQKLNEGLQNSDGRVSFCVPTGNFGNVLAGYVARQMGLAVERFVVASNRNDILTQFFTTGSMAIGEVRPTISPSMDIQVSSNLERLLFELQDRNGVRTATVMEDFRATGEMKIDARTLDELKQSWEGIRVSEEETTKTIASLYQRTGIVVDPHTAVGLAAAERSNIGSGEAMVVLATAHPAKFPEAVTTAIGQPPSVPPALAAVATLPEHYTTLPNNLLTIQNLIANCNA